ncbi:MAG TPA: hypothetical protein DCM32_06165 [Xanthomonadaceae bacterium]|jgi:hypothetical protein|nr:hypothetical protein [Xanthomonadaceae bacterium]
MQPKHLLWFNVATFALLLSVLVYWHAEGQDVALWMAFFALLPFAATIASIKLHPIDRSHFIARCINAFMGFNFLVGTIATMVGGDMKAVLFLIPFVVIPAMNAKLLGSLVALKASQ